MQRLSEGAPLVLASASPRRRELLALLGVRFDVVAADIDEAIAAESPRALVETLARQKALAVATRLPSSLVLGADTVVVLDGHVLGKPGDPSEARAMLAALRGRSHEVSTGVALVRGEFSRVSSVTTAVWMRAYSDLEVDRYVARGPSDDGPYDKAGSYALQDATFAPVAEASGCVCSVIGLPLWTVRQALRGAGVETSVPPLARCAGCPEQQR